MKSPVFYAAFLGVLILQTGVGEANRYDDDDDDYDDDEYSGYGYTSDESITDDEMQETTAPSHIPEFLSNNLDVIATVGETVNFPCEVNFPDDLNVAWEINGKVVSKSNISTLQDDRFQIVNGGSLQVSAVEPRDTGVYVCIITTEHHEIFLVHDLRVKSRPRQAQRCLGKSDKWIDLGGDYCYLIERDTEVRFIEAVYRCYQEGGSLATLNSMEEVKRIQRMLKNAEGKLYIGLWKNNEGSFEWVDESQSKFRKWARGEPNDIEERCVEMYLDSMKWNDIPCNLERGYLCSSLKTQSVPVPNGVCPDTSSDWMDYGTGYCYIIQLYDDQTWSGAEELCSAAGGSLASFHSVEEISVVREHIKDHHDRLHIGLRQTRDETFDWIDRSPVDLLFWDEGEPNDIDEQCGEIYPSSGYWNDIPCSKIEGYICSTPKVIPGVPQTELPPSPEDETCGGDVIAESGTIKSPNYPENYSPNTNCLWKITLPENFQIELSFEAFQLEYGADCEFDYVEVLDGHDEGSPVLLKMCGSEARQTLRSAGNKLALKFSSDKVNQRSGFLAEFKKAEQCGGNIVAEQGVIASRNYPQSYGPNEYCTWKIRVPEDNTVLLHFEAFEVEGSHDCGNDYVVILDGHDETSPVLGQYCGEHVPGDIRSSGHKMTVSFVSDGSREYYGFSAEFKKGEMTDVVMEDMLFEHPPRQDTCSDTIDYERGILVSPNFPEHYRNNEDCTWTIRAPAGSTISLRFKTIALEYSSGCTYDYISVHDGLSLSTERLGIFCGDNTPDVITSSGNAVTVHFASDSSSTSYGFSAIFNTSEGSFIRDEEENEETKPEEEENCKKHITADEGTIQSPNYPENYGPSQKCKWVITVPINHQVVLKFNAFKVETHIRCDYDYVLIRDGGNSESPVLAKFCGYEIPNEIRSSGNKLMIEFSSDSTVEYSGFSAEFKKDLPPVPTGRPSMVPGISDSCGGKLQSDTGTIQSPNYPDEYGPLANCTWYISVPEGNLVSFMLDFLDMEYSHHCIYDALTVISGDDLDGPVLSSVCSNVRDTRSTISPNNTLIVNFKSDDSIERKGFSGTFRKVISREETIFADQGVLQVPEDVKDFGYQFSWTVTVSENYTVLLKIRQENSTRRYHYASFHVEIHNGPDAYHQLDRYYAVLDSPDPYRSSGNSLYVLVTSDGSREAPFYAEFEKYFCGGDIVADSGVITSPNYPEKYNPSDNCTWRITVPEGYQVRLSFESFEVESSCSYDTVQIMDGHAPDTSHLVTLCGDRDPGVYYSRSNKMTVRFITDGSTQYKGFLAKFESGTKEICGGDIVADNGTITSPNYPEKYNPSDDCTWRITVPKGYQVRLSFESFRIESSCNYDTVQIMDGHAPDTSHLETLCGDRVPDVYYSRSNKMTVRFVTDSSTEYSGFLANFEKDTKRGCGEEFTAETGVISSPNFPDTYPSNSFCTSKITVPEGSTVTLKFTAFNTEENPRCTYDSVEVFEGHNPSTSRSLGKFCGEIIPSPIYSITNQMSVVFSSDGSSEKSGFSAEFSTDRCGGDFTAERGEISSPNFPALYPPHSSCTSKITVPEGGTVTLKFTAFHVEQNGDCLFDYVEVFEGHDPLTRQSLGRFCGESIPDAIHSTKNQMSVVFSSDGSVAYSGFSAEFSTEFISYNEVEDLLRELPNIIFDQAKRKPKPSRGKKTGKSIKKRSLIQALEETFKFMK